MNVLIGDMSLVGPRPEVPRYVEALRSEFAEVLVVRPGLTDLASMKYINESAVLACFSNPEEAYQTKILPEKLRLAKLYVRHTSFRLDFAILVQTLLRMVNSSHVTCQLPELEAAPKSPSAIPWTRLSSIIVKWRRPMIVLLDVVLIGAANYLAFVLRFDGRYRRRKSNSFRKRFFPSSVSGSWHLVSSVSTPGFGDIPVFGT